MYEKIVEYCKQNKISIAEFEKRCHIGNGTIGKWRLRSIQPSLGTLKKVSDATDLPLSYWIER